MENRKGNTFLILTLLVLVVACSVTFFLWTKRGNTNADNSTAVTETSTSKPNPYDKWTSYQGIGYSFLYPADVFVYPVAPNPAESVYFVNEDNVSGPREMTEKGIWFEVSTYPSTSKNGLVRDVQKIIDAEVGAMVDHPITPYSEKFVKVKNIGTNGVVIKSSETADVNDSREVESVLWLEGGAVVYQMRVVTVKQDVFNSFEDTFNNIVNTFAFKGNSLRDAKTNAFVEGVLRPALELYRSDNKKYPESITLLVPKYLTAMPIDPETNKPYLYTATNNGLDYEINVSLGQQNVKITAPK